MSTTFTRNETRSLTPPYVRPLAAVDRYVLLLHLKLANRKARLSSQLRTYIVDLELISAADVVEWLYSLCH